MPGALFTSATFVLSESNHIDQSHAEENHDYDSTKGNKESDDESETDSVATVCNSAVQSPRNDLVNGDIYDELQMTTNKKVPRLPEEEAPSSLPDSDLPANCNSSDADDGPRPRSPDSRKRKSLSPSSAEDCDQIEPLEKCRKINSVDQFEEITSTLGQRKKTTARKTITPVKSTRVVEKDQPQELQHPCENDSKPETATVNCDATKTENVCAAEKDQPQEPQRSGENEIKPETATVNGDTTKTENVCAVDSTEQIATPFDGTPKPEDSEATVPTINSLDEDSIKNIFIKMRRRLSRKQLEEIILQKCCEVIAENSLVGELKKQIAELQQAEAYRKHQVCSLEKQIHQLRGVCKVYMERVKELKENHRISNPTIITRSVGLQVAFDSNLKRKMAGLYKHPSASNNVSVSDEANNVHVNDGSNNAHVNDTSAERHSPLPKGTNTPPVTIDTAIIDLTDKDDKSDSPLKSIIDRKTNPVARTVPNNQVTNTENVANIKRNNFQTSRSRSHAASPSRHPAPLPAAPIGRSLLGLKLPPPTPELKICKNTHGISLNWNMCLTLDYAHIGNYQIYAYQETAIPASADLWKSVGTVNALPLPMACTLTQFVTGYTYHFAVRAVDMHGRIGPFSPPKSITL